MSLSCALTLEGTWALQGDSLKANQEIIADVCMHACMHACMYVCMYVCNGMDRNGRVGKRREQNIT